jgi:hypothetical protein
MKFPQKSIHDQKPTLFSFSEFLHIVTGAQYDKVENQLNNLSEEERQTLLLSIDYFKDNADRSFQCTAYEYAYWAKDTRMCRILERFMDDNTKTQMLARVEVVEANGLIYKQDGEIYKNPHYDMSFALKNLNPDEFWELKAQLGKKFQKINHATVDSYKFISFTAVEFNDLKKKLSECRTNCDIATKLKFDFCSYTIVLQEFNNQRQRFPDSRLDTYKNLEVAQRDVPMHVTYEYFKPNGFDYSRVTVSIEDEEVFLDYDGEKLCALDAVRSLDEMRIADLAQSRENLTRPLIMAGLEQASNALIPELQLRLQHHFLDYVAKGWQAQADYILKHSSKEIRPYLLTITGVLTDYSDRTFECTAYEYAYWAKNIHMCCMLELYMDEHIKAEILARVENIEAKGLAYQQHGNYFQNAHYDMSFILRGLRKKEFLLLKTIVNATHKKFDMEDWRSVFLKVHQATSDNYPFISFTADEFLCLKSALLRFRYKDLSNKLLFDFTLTTAAAPDEFDIIMIESTHMDSRAMEGLVVGDVKNARDLDIMRTNELIQSRANLNQVPTDMLATIPEKRLIAEAKYRIKNGKRHWVIVLNRLSAEKCATLFSALEVSDLKNITHEDIVEMRNLSKERREAIYEALKDRWTDLISFQPGKEYLLEMWLIFLVTEEQRDAMYDTIKHQIPGILKTEYKLLGGDAITYFSQEQQAGIMSIKTLMDDLEAIASAEVVTAFATALMGDDSAKIRTKFDLLVKNTNVEDALYTVLSKLDAIWFKKIAITSGLNVKESSPRSEHFSQLPHVGIFKSTRAVNQTLLPTQPSVSGIVQNR